MTELITLSEDLKNEIKVDSEGKGYVSIRGASRLFGVNHSTFVKQFAGGPDTSSMSEKLTAEGFKVEAFSVNGIPDLALPVIADYYAFESKQASEEVKTNCLNFIRLTSSIGVRVWMQKIKGYEPMSVNQEMLLQIMNTLNEVKQKQDSQQLLLESSRREKEELEEQVDALMEFKDDVENYTEFARMLEITTNDIGEDDYPDGISCLNYLRLNGIPLDQNAWCTLTRRTASYYRSTKGRSPQKRYGQFIYRNKDVAFIIATIRLIMRGL